jgi:hypothetical protein
MAKKCFVLMPFKKTFNTIYQRTVKPAVKKAGFDPVRADEIYGARPVLEDIIKETMEATVLIADVSTKNPNVNYELGLAHAVGQPVIIITNNSNDVPFDYQHFRYHRYSRSLVGMKLLAQTIENALDEVSNERFGMGALLGRWIGWYRECDEVKWRPTAHEIQIECGKLKATAYGTNNRSESICTFLKEDKHRGAQLIWTYDSRNIRGKDDLAEHTGTHIASFTVLPNGKRLMDGIAFNTRRPRNVAVKVGSVVEFNCEWVSEKSLGGLQFSPTRWPKVRP